MTDDVDRVGRTSVRHGCDEQVVRSSDDCRGGNDRSAGGRRSGRSDIGTGGDDRPHGGRKAHHRHLLSAPIRGLGGERIRARQRQGKGKNKHGNLPPGLAKKGTLPPGLAKQLARNGTLPPGLAKRALPHDLLVQLPPPPPGCELVLVDDRVMLVRAATNLILDVLVVAAAEAS